MKKIHILLAFIALFSSSQQLSAQLDSIYDQNVWRTFIVHLPAGYKTSNHYPIVLNLHGYNSNAVQQESYTQFDIVSNTYGFIVVYPNGISNSWSINGNTDVNFISHLVDTIRIKYSTNSCLFITGMSDGGFMTYKLACTLSKPITAIAVGSGNMAKTLQTACITANKIPVMHFHGTADPLVNYDGVSPLIPAVDSTIKWWVNHNNANTTPVFTAIPDINTSDNATAEKYYYSGGASGSEMTFYKIINGGHTWSGAAPVPALGNTCMDINQSSVIGQFFAGYCSIITSINDPVNKKLSVQLYPNPANDKLTIRSEKNFSRIDFYDTYGQLIKTIRLQNKEANISITELSKGVYFIKANWANGDQWTGKLIKE